MGGGACEGGRCHTMGAKYRSCESEQWRVRDCHGTKGGPRRVECVGEGGHRPVAVGEVGEGVGLPSGSGACRIHRTLTVPMRKNIGDLLFQ